MNKLYKLIVLALLALNSLAFIGAASAEVEASDTWSRTMPISIPVSVGR